ncbi:MAG TPA: dihydrofolate reductase [Patescibacteria group bacterium]|nr:dihydrofolate reductase [Patescibacteria group bacterium]
MNKPRISIIAALSDNRVIGNKGEIPWHIPGEQKRVKELTTPHPLIMGRKTHESIGRVLPGRLNIIVTSDPHYQVEGGEVVHSLPEAITLASKADSEEIFIFGGANLYAQALPQVNRLYLTIVHKTMEGDAFFPDYSEFVRVVSKEEHKYEDYNYTYLTLER